MEYSKAQQKYLRKASHQHKALFQLGKLGITDTFIEQVDAALEKRELIKFHILQNSSEDIDEASALIAEKTGAFIVQVIGSTVILFRPSSQEKYQDLSREVKQIK